MAAEEQDAWHLGRRVPLALVATIVIQSLAAVWWASAIDQRMKQFEETLRAAADQAGRIVRLEAQGEIMVKTLDRVEMKVDKIIDGDKKGTRP